MPWTAESFRREHNKKLSLGAARHAATQATAMIAHRVPEGTAIATANRYANKGYGAKPKGGKK